MYPSCSLMWSLFGSYISAAHTISSVCVQGRPWTHAWSYRFQSKLLFDVPHLSPRSCLQEHVSTIFCAVILRLARGRTAWRGAPLSTLSSLYQRDKPAPRLHRTLM